MSVTTALPRRLVPWLLLGLLAAVVALSIGVLKGATATERVTRDAIADERKINDLSGQVAELHRETDVKSQQLRDAGIPESPLAATTTTAAPAAPRPSPGRNAPTTTQPSPTPTTAPSGPPTTTSTSTTTTTTAPPPTCVTVGPVCLPTKGRAG